MKKLALIALLTLAAIQMGCASLAQHGTVNPDPLPHITPGSNASAATDTNGIGLPVTPNPSADPLDLSDLGDKIHADLQAAHDDAQAFGDPLGAQCFEWALANPLALPSGDRIKAAASLPIVGALSGFEKLRIGVQVVRDSEATVAAQLAPGSKWRTGLAQGCGPLLVDARMTVVDFLAKIGLPARLLAGVK